MAIFWNHDGVPSASKHILKCKFTPSSSGIFTVVEGTVPNGTAVTDSGFTTNRSWILSMTTQYALAIGYTILPGTYSFEIFTSIQAGDPDGNFYLIEI